MTRVNCVPPDELCDQHLLAEAREIPRIPNGLLSGRLKKPTRDEALGERYRLGKGHVRFFCCRLCWLFSRYHLVLVECKKRGFRVADRWPTGILPWAFDYYRDTVGHQVAWYAEDADQDINRQRIAERMPEKPRWT